MPGVPVPFDYYHRLTSRQKRIYRASDERPSLDLGPVSQLLPIVDRAREALEEELRGPLTRACQELVDAIDRHFQVPAVTVRVLAARPSRSWGELHGLYEPEDEERAARITVWMRTAQRQQVVAFRTFLRTLLHEVCHHLDYEYLKLEETFHTEGFFQRESSLFKQLVPPTAKAGGTRGS